MYISSLSLVVMTTGFDPVGPGSNPGGSLNNFLRGLMVMMPGFHPVDRGSIPR